MTKELTERNQEMVRLYLEDGVTTKDIGSRFGVSPQRVRQILRHEGVSALEVEVVDRIRRVHWWSCDACGVSRWAYGELQARQRFCSGCTRIDTPEYTYRRVMSLLRHMRALGSESGRAPTMSEINAAPGPADKTYFAWFGAFRTAQWLAGFEPNPVGFQGSPEEGAP